MMNKKGFSLIEFLMFILICGLIVSFILGYNGCGELKTAIKEKGVKGVLTEVWEGPDAPKK